MAPPSLLAAAAVVLAVTSHVAQAQPRVSTDLGDVVGIEVGGRAAAYLGVPYARPPTGRRRWRVPKPVRPWAPRELDASKAPPGCPQRCALPPHTCPEATSEDCLFLNVWTPLGTRPVGGPDGGRDDDDGGGAGGGGRNHSGLPVAVFLHGGQFTSGYAGGQGSVYDGSDVASSTGTVWVHVNYRLGALGFLHLGLPEGAAATPGGRPVDGNYGLRDQELALRWVARHIRAFGGDPARVTLVGQSAGAVAVAAHMSRRETWGLYAGAVMHSPPLSLPFRDAAAQQRQLTRKMLRATGCSRPEGGGGRAGRRGRGARRAADDEDEDGAPDPSEGAQDWAGVERCLRGKSAGELVDAQEAVSADWTAQLTDFIHAAMPFVPTTGTEYLRDWPLDALMAGAVADVPVLIGATSAEADLFVYGPTGMFKQPVGEMMYSLGVSFVLGGARSAAITEAYPTPRGSGDATDPVDLRPHIARVLGDGLFVCPARAAAAALSAAPRRASKTHAFVYDSSFAFGEAAWGRRFPACWSAACHGTDLLSLFHPDVTGVLGGADFTPREHGLSAAMQGYWGAFLHTGKPGDGSLPEDAIAAVAASGAAMWEGAGARAASTGGAKRKVWRVYAGRRLALRLAADLPSGAGKVVDYHGAECDAVWDKHGYQLGRRCSPPPAPPVTTTTRRA